MRKAIGFEPTMPTIIFRRISEALVIGIVMRNLPSQKHVEPTSLLEDVHEEGVNT